MSKFRVDDILKSADIDYIDTLESKLIRTEKRLAEVEREQKRRDIEQQIKTLTFVLRTYKTKRFYPTNYAIQAFNDGVAHLWTHIESCEHQIRQQLNGGE